MDSTVRRREADARLREAKAGVLRRDDDVARECQLATTTQSEAIHGGDDRLDHCEPLGQATKATRFEREPVRLRWSCGLTVLQVGTRAEGPVTSSGEDGHPGIIIGLEASPRAIHLGMRGRMQSVAHLGATDGKDCNSPVLLLLVRKELELPVFVLRGVAHADTPSAIAETDEDFDAGSASGPSNAPRLRKTSWISATSSWRGDIFWRTARAAATPAASPTTNIGGISRLIFCASEVAEKQRPATSRFSTPTGSRVRYG